MVNGGLWSYGLMIYVGLKSLIYVGVDKDDFCVKVVLKWLSLNYWFNENLNMGVVGLYYYYYMFVKVFEVMGELIFVDSDGVEYVWCVELIWEFVGC